MSYSKRVPFVIIVALACGPAAFAQRNNPFSANPDVRTTIAAVDRNDLRTKRSPVDAGSANSKAELTKIYKVGTGDTLHIVLANAANAVGNYTVGADGTIDFPLAGDSPRVLGMTTAEIEQMLSSRVKLYRHPQLQVKVNEFASHKVNVTGLVERNGERFLPREAMPLFTIKADVGVDRNATIVIIRRSSGSSEIYRLNDARTDDVLVSSGDTIEFVK